MKEIEYEIKWRVIEIKKVKVSWENINVNLPFKNEQKENKKASKKTL